MIIAKGTKVTITTTNGGETTVILDHNVELSADGLPQYPFSMTSLFGGRYTMMPTRVRTFTPAA